jgi:hypothetical protein
MKKIRLNLDALSVESFDTTAAEAKARGTVHGNAESFQVYCSDGSTCYESACGSCVSQCGSCNDATCGETYCGSCDACSCCCC